MTFIELPLFTKQITSLVPDEVYLDFQKGLIRRPEQGDVIPHSGGLRKARMVLAGRGKRGGAWVIYLHVPQQEVIVLFHAYTKAACEDISADQLKRLRMAAETIKREFRHEAKRD